MASEPTAAGRESGPPDDEAEAEAEAAADLIRHNAEYDRWEAMTAREKEDAIRWAMN